MRNKIQNTKQLIFSGLRFYFQYIFQHSTGWNVLCSYKYYGILKIEVIFLFYYNMGQVLKVKLALYSFLWVIPRRLNFMYRRFGTFCQFHLHRWCKQKDFNSFGLLSSSFFSLITPPMKMEQSVPKRRHINFRSQRIAQRKNTTFRTRRKFEIKNSYFVGN